MPSRPALAQAVGAAVFAEVQQVLGSAGIAVLPVKGVVTARTLYADPSEREIRDVDVRIIPSDFARALAIARHTAGWRVRLVVHAYRSVTVAVGGLDVDIETSCGPPGFCGLRVEAMLARAVPGPSAELPWMPEIHDHALLLVVNAVKDHVVLNTPAAMEDLRRIVGRPGFSPDVLLRRASDAHALFMVHVVARHLSGTVPGWQEMDSRLGRDHPLQSVEAALFLALVGQRGGDSIAVRMATRLAPDGWLRPCRALLQAGLYEVEGTWQRAFVRRHVRP